jgi:carbamoyl-phosphate synthase large subunit
MGIGDDFGTAFFKSQEATGSPLPLEGNVLLTVAEKDKTMMVPVAKRLAKLGFKIIATSGTGALLTKNGIKNILINKVQEGQPNITDAIKNGQLQLIINTPAGRGSLHDDSYIRMMAIQRRIPYVTSGAAAEATVEGIEAVKKGQSSPRPLQDYHRKAKK